MQKVLKSDSIIKARYQNTGIMKKWREVTQSILKDKDDKIDGEARKSYDARPF